MVQGCDRLGVLGGNGHVDGDAVVDPDHVGSQVDHRVLGLHTIQDV